MKLFIVNTISTFRHQYVIKAKSLEHAMDEVTMKESGQPADEFSEFTQKYLGETIIDGEEIDMDKFNALLVKYKNDQDESCNHWLGEQLIREIKYED